MSNSYETVPTMSRPTTTRCANEDSNVLCIPKWGRSNSYGEKVLLRPSWKNNVFNNDTFEGSPLLQNAIAGCLAGLSDLALIYAPHANSYERLVPESHAPTSICWAYDNRTASVRVPGGSFKARRIEHRVAGGDVNPYLFLAAVLGSALIGIEDGLTPPAPITGNAYDQKLQQLPAEWSDAITAFETGEIPRRIFDKQLVDNFLRTKRQELRDFQELTPDEQLALYLDTV